MQSLELMDNSKMPKLRNELTITDEPTPIIEILYFKKEDVYLVSDLYLLVKTLNLFLKSTRPNVFIIPNNHSQHQTK